MDVETAPENGEDHCRQNPQDIFHKRKIGEQHADYQDGDCQCDGPGSAGFQRTVVPGVCLFGLFDRIFARMGYQVIACVPYG